MRFPARDRAGSALPEETWAVPVRQHYQQERIRLNRPNR